MNILMVCLGNICRSPLAHGVLQHMANQRGLNWTIESAGIGGWHVGNPPDHRAIMVAKQHGIDIRQQRAQQFRDDHFDAFDHIFAMDRANLRNLMARGKTAGQRARIQLFLEDSEVPDPYYDNHLFEPVYQLVQQRCNELIEILS
ncbi:low molecular weight protein-tyrosine-phosphatase [Parapedobacter indicus]|uniref:protein-tyrosine-phosphatase n=1 Tax=Parapedobacter indicus TaxID=1477437 RepID=A0A1I3KSH7_9SPHI|nr:low molecular weight protein-tyrosine-phosphatase [Parapedobacter indicus]PPL01907.1 protein-tyrosine phosphatase [Parapedobacter indicus]SFI75298.1 protein-tyrosine phosphatase [Parapedobacter indicus]